MLFKKNDFFFVSQDISAGLLYKYTLAFLILVGIVQRFSFNHVHYIVAIPRELPVNKLLYVLHNSKKVAHSVWPIASHTYEQCAHHTTPFRAYVSIIIRRKQRIVLPLAAPITWALTHGTHFAHSRLLSYMILSKHLDDVYLF